MNIKNKGKNGCGYGDECNYKGMRFADLYIYASISGNYGPTNKTLPNNFKRILDASCKNMMLNIMILHIIICNANGADLVT